MTTKEIVLITGANTGIGFELVKALFGSEKAYCVILSGRSLDKVEAAAKQAKELFPSSKSEVSTLQLDIEDDDSIKKAVSKIESDFGRVDALVNNAGAQFDAQMDDNDLSSIREIYNKTNSLNVTSTHVITHAVAPLLIKSESPRLLFVVSGTASISEAAQGMPYTVQPIPAGWPKPKQFFPSCYRISKAGTCMMVVEWQRRLKADNVKVWGISPGFLATGLGGNAEVLKKLGAQDPSVGGQFMKNVLEGKRDADVGRVIRSNDTIQPW